MIDRNQIEDFQRCGYVLLSSVIQGDQLDHLIREVDRAFESPDARRHRGISFALRRAEARVVGVASLATSSPMIDLARNLVGQKARPVRGLIFDKQLGANWDVPWHRDQMIAVAERVTTPPAGFGAWSMKEGFPHIRAPRDLLGRMVSLRLHLDDCPVDQGALQVISGSHQGFESDFRRSHRQPVACEARRGDVLAMRPSILHASWASVHPSHRRVIHLEYAGEDLPEPLSWAAWPTIRPACPERKGAV